MKFDDIAPGGSAHRRPTTPGRDRERIHAHLRIASEAITEAITQATRSFDAVGGLTMGADPLAVALAAVSDCRYFPMITYDLLGIDPVVPVAAATA